MNNEQASNTLIIASKATKIALGVVTQSMPMISMPMQEDGNYKKMDAFLFGGVYGESQQLQALGFALSTKYLMDKLYSNDTYFDSAISWAVNTLKFKTEQFLFEAQLGLYGAVNIPPILGIDPTALVKQTLMPSFPSANAKAKHSDSTRGQYFQFYFRSLKPSVWKSDSDITKKLAPKGVVRFNPIITSLSESISPKWSQHNILGSVQQLHRYERTDRTIELGFTLFADSFAELQFNIWRLNWLADHCYGSMKNFDEFQSQRSLPGGDKSKFVQNVEYKEFPFMKVTLGTVFVELPCYITSLRNTYSVEDQWELGDEMENIILKRKNIQFPFKVDVALSLNVLYDKEDPTSYNYYRQYFETEMGKYLRYNENNWSTNPEDDNVGGLISSIRNLF